MCDRGACTGRCCAIGQTWVGQWQAAILAPAMHPAILSRQQTGHVPVARCGTPLRACNGSGSSWRACTCGDGPPLFYDGCGATTAAAGRLFAFKVPSEAWLLLRLLVCLAGPSTACASLMQPCASALFGCCMMQHPCGLLAGQGSHKKAEPTWGSKLRPLALGE
eukprot:356123-Chlamydomonas_euryale.AAC.6